MECSTRRRSEVQVLYRPLSLTASEQVAPVIGRVISISRLLRERGVPGALTCDPSTRFLAERTNRSSRLRFRGGSRSPSSVPDTSVGGVIRPGGRWIDRDSTTVEHVHKELGDLPGLTLASEYALLRLKTNLRGQLSLPEAFLPEEPDLPQAMSAVEHQGCQGHEDHERREHQDALQDRSPPIATRNRHSPSLAPQRLDLADQECRRGDEKEDDGQSWATRGGDPRQGDQANKDEDSRDGSQPDRVRRGIPFNILAPVMPSTGRRQCGASRRFSASQNRQRRVSAALGPIVSM